MDTPTPAPRPSRKRWGAAIERIARERILSRLDRRRVILRWHPEAARIAPSPTRPLVVDSLAALPASITNEIDPSGLPRDWYRHFFAHGAVLWTTLENGRALGMLWVINSKRLGAWYVALEPDAQVIYGVVTPKWARGRGIAAQLALAAARAADGAPVYLDCMAWNRAAHRAFAKAGFVPVATVGSRWREVRAGEHPPDDARVSRLGGRRDAANVVRDHCRRQRIERRLG
jgi:predicted GNAT family acetyltransferase